VACCVVEMFVLRNGQGDFLVLLGCSLSRSSSIASCRRNARCRKFDSDHLDLSSTTATDEVAGFGPFHHLGCLHSPLNHVRYGVGKEIWRRKEAARVEQETRAMGRNEPRTKIWDERRKGGLDQTQEP